MACITPDMMQAYLDNSATTRPCEAAVEAMVRSMREGYYNPAALYAPAVAVEHELRAARETLAASVQAGEQQVIFTSGGTEADNLAIIGHAGTWREPGDILFSAAEHPAVKNACLEAAALFGHSAQPIPLDARGLVDLQALEQQLTPRTRLICVMQVCNETGAVMPLTHVVALRDRFAPQAAIHVDGVQGYLRLPFSMKTLGVQSYAVSAHKVHGPKGVGALIVQRNHRLRPLMVGGGQQRNLRSGTDSVAAALGFAAAVRAYPVGEAQARLLALKRIAVEALAAAIPAFRVIGPQVDDPDAAGHILYAAFPPVRAETLLHALEEVGVLVGTGSACSSHKRKPSEVLTAMGVPLPIIESSIRLSFAHTNTEEEIRYAVAQIIEKYQFLARFTRR